MQLLIILHSAIIVFIPKFLSRKIMMELKHCDVNDNDTYALGNTSFPSKHNV